jgi:hypothetical protein
LSRAGSRSPAAWNWQCLVFDQRLPLKRTPPTRAGNPDKTDVAAARRMMVAGQIRTSDVRDLQVIAAMAAALDAGLIASAQAVELKAWAQIDEGAKATAASYSWPIRPTAQTTSALGARFEVVRQQPSITLRPVQPPG